MRKKRLISFVAGDFTKHVDVTKVGRESKIQSIANRFCNPQIAFENYRARWNRIFDVESGNLYTPQLHKLPESPSA